MTAQAWAEINVTELQCPDGAVVVIADHGAHVLSWRPAGKTDAMYLSADSGFGAGSAIRGGVPVIFPQFGEMGTGKRHGFARVCDWRRSFAGIVKGRAVARYALSECDIDPAYWPHRFALDYEVAVQANQLQLSLSVTNTDTHDWSFNAALHTYLHVGDVAQIGLSGLQGLRYVDKVSGAQDQLQQEASLRIVGEVDRVYGGVHAPLTLHDGAGSVTIRQSGFVDAVVWNPGTEKAAMIGDLTPGASTSFVCVEAASVLVPITLAPGASWRGSQFLELQQTD